MFPITTGDMVLIVRRQEGRPIIFAKFNDMVCPDGQGGYFYSHEFKADIPNSWTRFISRDQNGLKTKTIMPTSWILSMETFIEPANTTVPIERPDIIVRYL